MIPIGPSVPTLTLIPPVTTPKTSRNLSEKMGNKKEKKRKEIPSILLNIIVTYPNQNKKNSFVKKVFPPLGNYLWNL